MPESDWFSEWRFSTACDRANLCNPDGEAVTLSPGTIADIRLWSQFQGESSKEAFLFPSEARAWRQPGSLRNQRSQSENRG